MTSEENKEYGYEEHRGFEIVFISLEAEGRFILQTDLIHFVGSLLLGAFW